MLYNRHINTFLCVARCGSFSKAAEELHLSPAAISAHIDDLEEIVDRKLFIRNSKGVCLTDYGSHFISECYDMIKYSEDIIQRTRFSGSDEIEPVRIACFPLAPLGTFYNICLHSSALCEFRTSLIQYNDNLNIENNTPEVPEISFGIEKLTEEFSVFNFLPLSEQKLTCVVPVRHRLAKKEILTYDDLSGETLYFPFRGNPNLTRHFCGYILQNYPNITVDPQPIFYDLNVLNRCVRENKILIGFDFWNNIHPGLVNLPVKWEWSVPYGVIWRNDARKEVLDFMKTFIDALKHN